jgi:hypothetical protein
MKKWQEYEQNNQYYYNESDGMVIGQVHCFGASTSLHTATVKPDNIDKILGFYVSRDYAKQAVERFWEREDRTLLEQ